MTVVVGLKTEIEVGESAKSIKTLKTELKSLQQELDGVAAGSKEAVAVMQKMANVKDEIDDLNESVGALTGGGKFQAIANLGGTIASGFSAAQGAMALFGTQSEDLEKTLLKVQAASALASGLKEMEGLGDALNNAKNAAKGLWQVIVANPMLAIAAAVAALVMAFAAWRDKMIEAQDPLKKMRERFDELKKSTESLSSQYDIQIKSLQGLKANEEEILVLQEKKLRLQIMLKVEALKLAQAEMKRSIDAVNQANKEVTLGEKVLLQVTNMNGLRDLGKQKILEEAQARQKNAEAQMLELENAKAELKAFENGLQQRKIDKQKEYNEKHKEEIEHRKFLDLINAAGGAQDIARKEQQIQLQTAVNNELRGTINLNAELARRLELEELRKRLAEEQSALAKIGTITRIAELEKQIADEKSKQKEKEQQEDLATYTKRLGYAENFYGSLTSMSSSLNEIQKNKLKDGEKLSVEAQKRAFQREKALNIVGALINGSKAVTQIMGSTPAPAWPFLIPASVAATALQIAAISSRKFNPEGGGDGGSVAGMSGGSVGTFSQLSNTPQQTSTQLNEDGSVKKEMPSIKAHVVANEMTAQQEVEKKIQNNNMFE
jgi:hypothetical protein